MESLNNRLQNRKGFHVDTHVHTNLSGDGRSNIRELAEAAIAKGLDAIVLTDHNICAIDSPVLYKGLWLLPGCECSTDAGHILGLFFSKPPDLNALTANGLPRASDAVSVLRECGALTVLAHPYTRENMNPDVLADCVETSNSRAAFKNPKANEQAALLAQSRGLPGTGGSDAHSRGEVGNAYTVIYSPDCSPASLRDAVLSGKCRSVLARNTPRRYKGLSQFIQAIRSRKPLRILKGVLYIGYCIVLDIFKL